MDGKVTTFGTTGYTFNNVFVLYDRRTHTVWYPLKDGAFDAIGGPKRGARIPFLAKPPIVTLGEWRRQHPDTNVLLMDAPPPRENESKKSPAPDPAPGTRPGEPPNRAGAGPPASAGDTRTGNRQDAP